MTRSTKRRTARGAPQFRDLPKTYAGLVAILPPRPIHAEDQHAEVQEMIDALAGHKLSRDQADYLDALTTFAAAHEQEHHAIDVSDLTPTEMLRHLMEENEMTASELGELLGDRSLGSRILSGERQLSKEHIRRLCTRFKVSADLFIGQEVDRAQR